MKTVNSDLDRFAKNGFTPTNSKETNALVAEQEKLDERLAAARKKLSIAIQEAAHKQAEAERKAAEKAQRAAEKSQHSLSKSVKHAKAMKKESLGIAKGFSGAGKAVKRFGTRLIGIISSALIFNVISSGLRELTSYMNSALKTNKEFATEVAKIKGALLTAFQPIYSYVLPVIVKLMRYLSAAASMVAYFFSVLSGTSIKNNAKAAEKLYNEANAIDAVGSAAKKTSKALSGFDEINVLSSADDVGSGGSSDVVMPDFSGLDASQFTTDFGLKISNLAESIKSQILAGDWFGAGATVGEAFSEGLESIDWEGIGSSIGKILGGAASFAIGFAFNIDPMSIAESVAEFATGLYNSLSDALNGLDWNQIGEDIADVLFVGFLLAIFGFIPGFISITILSLLEDSLNNLLTIALGLVGLILGGLPGMITGLILASPQKGDLASSVARFVGTLLGSLLSAIVGAGKRIWEIAKTIWNGIVEWFETYIDWGGTPGEIIAGLWQGIKDALKGAGDWIYNNIWVPFRDGFKESFDIHSPSGKMKEFGQFIIEGLKNGLVGRINIIKQACTDILTAIKEKFTNIPAWFKEKFSDAWQKVKDVFSKGGKVYNGIKEGIESTFKTIVNSLISGINRIISTPFSRINSLLNTIRSISVLGTRPFIDIWNYNPLPVPQIPYLAKGAVLPANKPFMAVVGDQRHGTNVEAPLTVIQEAVAAVMQDYAASNMAGHEATVAVLRELLEAVLGISIGDEVIASAVQRYDRKMAVVRGGYV